jgi:hypothetical protein
MLSTKRQSIEELTADGSRSRRKRHVYLCIKNNPGVSRNEIEREAHIRLSCVCGRANELLVSGDVIELGTKIDPITKKHVGRLYATVGPKEQLCLELK